MSRRRLHVFTNSEVETWRTCRARWGFTYAELMRPVVRPAPLSFGSLAHAGTAAGWRAAWDRPEDSVDNRALRAIPAAFEAIAAAAERSRLELAGLDQTAREEAEAELVERRDVAQWVVMHYFDVRRDDLRLVPLLVEAPFEVAVPTNAGVPGYLRHAGVLDLALWDREQATVALLDHKTSAYGADTLARKLPLDTQMTGYLRALRDLLEDYHPDSEPWLGAPLGARQAAGPFFQEVRRAGTGLLLFNVLRRAKPHTPAVNKLALPAAVKKLETAPLAILWREQEADGVPRGEVSAAAIDTTAKVYRQALQEQELARHQPITDKQRARLAQLEQRGETYVEGLEFYRGASELERWRREMWVEARQMRAAERDPLLRTRNPSACSSPSSPRCVYAPVCLAPDSPEARAEFRVASSRHEEVSEAHAERRSEGDERDGRAAPGAGDAGDRF